ncbi:MAG: SAM-dependent methyltransferase, partial [Candidatus Limnocylindrales bacterium]
MKQSQNQGDEVLKGVGLTALIVAQARALESKRPDSLFIDPFAEDFVARAGEAFLKASAEFAPILALRGNGRYFALRTRFFDDFVVDVCRAGCQQVILLGAGLDTRAFRIVLPEGVRLFELDLPHVLAFKEEVLSARAVAPIC